MIDLSSSMIFQSIFSQEERRESRGGGRELKKEK
jgi:hypothetical protein